VHKLHFDNNAELTLSRLRIYRCAPLIEARDRHRVADNERDHRDQRHRCVEFRVLRLLMTTPVRVIDAILRVSPDLLEEVNRSGN